MMMQMKIEAVSTWIVSPTLRHVYPRRCRCRDDQIWNSPTVYSLCAMSDETSDRKQLL